MAALLLAAGCVDRVGGPAPQVGTMKPGYTPNRLCHMCHVAHTAEPLAVAHAKAGVWCRTCHGLSIGHMNDDNTGATRPDKVYKKADVPGMCGKCHDAKEHPTVPDDVRAARLAKGKRLQSQLKGRTVEPTGVCTDCHGNHWIPQR